MPRKLDLNSEGRRRDLTGQRFGRWTVVAKSGRLTRDHYPYWSCRCECGRQKEVLGQTLMVGDSQSCGCLAKERRAAGTRRVCTKHGMARSPLYLVWSAMISRCYNVNDPQYPNYGARGIRVCERWREDFAAFLEDMGPRPARHSIERVDNARGYEPGNCRWATQREQARNTRSNRVIEFRGERRCVVEWAEILGIPASTIYNRVYYGWDAERILGTPVDLKKARRGRSSSASVRPPL